MPWMGSGCQGWVVDARDGWQSTRGRAQAQTETSGSPPLQAEAMCQSWGWASPRCPGILPSRDRRGRAGHRGSDNSVFLPSPLVTPSPKLLCAVPAGYKGHMATLGCPFIPHCPVGQSSSSSSPGGPGELGLETPHRTAPKWPKFPFLGGKLWPDHHQSIPTSPL